MFNLFGKLIEFFNNSSFSRKSWQNTASIEGEEKNKKNATSEY